MAGQDEERALITNISNEERCVVTTLEPHNYVSGDLVRLTDMNSSIPTLRGMNQLNWKKFRVERLDDTSFFIKYPLKDEFVNSSNFTPYVEGGRCNLVQTKFIYKED